MCPSPTDAIIYGMPAVVMPESQDKGGQGEVAVIPLDFVSLRGIYIILYAKDDTDEIKWELNVSHGKSLEDLVPTHDYGDKETLVTGDKINEVQLTYTEEESAPDIEKGDYVAINFQRKGSKDDFNGSCYLLGMIIEYNAQSETSYTETNYTQIKVDNSIHFDIGDITITKGEYGSAKSKIKVDFTHNSKYSGRRPCYWCIEIREFTDAKPFVVFYDNPVGKTDFSTGELEFDTPPAGEYLVIITIL